MEERNIAWLGETYDKGRTADVFEIILRRNKINVKYLRSAREAIEEFKRLKYEKIVCGLHVAPLDISYVRGNGTSSGDLTIDEIMKRNSEQQKYGEIGLRVIQLIRESEANRRTPVIVVTCYDPVNERFLADAKRKSIQNGADHYIHIYNDDDRIRLTSLLRN